MKTAHSVLIAVIVVSISAFGQQHKAASTKQRPVPAKPKPNLSEPFAKSGIKALIAIGDFRGTGALTGRAEAVYEDARAEMDPKNADEVLMMANLLNFAMLRSNDNIERKTISLKAETKLYEEGKKAVDVEVFDKLNNDPEFSKPLAALNKREVKCSLDLENAFRDRLSIALPDSCS